jgi:hypothetical protein
VHETVQLEGFATLQPRIHPTLHHLPLMDKCSLIEFTRIVSPNALAG